jgi:peptidyl-prolyl cis-trans isomerase-like 4
MSVMLETSLGDLIIDLETERCPRTCENFLKLCKMKYYALNAFFNGTSVFSFSSYRSLNVFAIRR